MGNSQSPIAEKGIDISPGTEVQVAGANSTQSSTLLHNSIYTNIFISSTSLLFLLVVIGFILIAVVYCVLRKHHSATSNRLHNLAGLVGFGPEHLEMQDLEAGEARK